METGNQPLEAWKQLVQGWNQLGSSLVGLGVTAIIGVWWARITPAQSNTTLILSVLGVGAGVAILTRELPLLLRVLWAGASVCGLGLIVNYVLWIPRAETLDTKKTVLAAVEDVQYRNLVAEIIHAFEPSAYISVGGVLLGPDGERTVDIQVWPVRSDIPGPIIIDVIDRNDGKPVGIEAVDAADSMRRDVRAKVLLLCSNTGFDDSAIKKAKRANIGLISALKQGDKRIRAKIEEELYLRKVDVAQVTSIYDGETPKDIEVIKQYMTRTHDITYEGGSVDGWLQERIMMVVFQNPKVEGALIARYEFKRPTQFLLKGHKLTLRAISIRFHPRVQWLSQIVTLDAKAGIYDYVRGHVRFSDGPNSYVISGVNFDTATPINSPPDISNPGVGLLPGEVDIQLMMMQGLDRPQGTEAAKLTDLIRPEDLSLNVTGAPPKQEGYQAGSTK